MYIALLKAQVSLQLRKIFSSDKEVSVCIMCSYMYWLLHYYTTKTEIRLYLIPCMNTGYLYDSACGPHGPV